MTKRIRVRYAPSPTGHLHIGNARTALFNYLFAKHYQGDFILRIEDTDIERNVEGGEESQLTYLEWLGVAPDESPKNPGKHGPYRQMERLDLYQSYAKQLIQNGFAYQCYCTTEELDLDYQKQTTEGQLSTRYNRKCWHLSDAEKKANEEAQTPFTIRIKVPEDTTYTFFDMIRSEVTFESKDIGDWVLIKANGIPTYNYAVVIDDYSMDISHVFRGEEHLSNTPKQLMLYQMFGWQTPEFGHMTLIVNEQRKKLSKRDHSIMQYLSQYKEQGYLPEAMFNFMALLGWSPETEQEIFTKEELIAVFDEKRLSKSPSMFDKQKLMWVNNRYIKELPLSDVVKLCKPFLQDQYDLSSKSEPWIETLVALYHDQLSYGAQINELVSIFFETELAMDDEALAVLQWETTSLVAQTFKNSLPDVWSVDNIKESINQTKEKSGVKGKPLFMGLRVVITGSCHGPDLVNTITLIGKETVISRLEKAQ